VTGVASLVTTTKVSPSGDTSNSRKLGTSKIVCGRPASKVEPVERRDVRVVQRCQELRFPLEASEPLFVTGELFGQDFDGDVALQLRIDGTVDLTHPTNPDGLGDLVVSQTGPRLERHDQGAILAGQRV